MAKKKSYDAYVRQQIGDLIDQLDLPELYKHSLKDRWLDQMIWADKKASENRKLYYRLRLTTIIGGVILPALVGISVQLGTESPFFRVWFPPLTFMLSQVIAVSVAIEEFCKFGDRWRDYRKMAEDLKSEGWQYLQSSGPYEHGMNHVPESFQPYGKSVVSESDHDRLSNSFRRFESNNGFELNNGSKRQKTHLDNYAQFANRIESIIKNDVQSYISNLVQQQAKQDVAAQQVLAQAQAVGTNKSLIAQLNQNYPPNVLPSSPEKPHSTPTALELMNGASSSEAIASAVGTLRVVQDTTFKASTQAAQILPDSQKVNVGNGSTFIVISYTVADQNHLQVTLNQGLGAENRNSWFVFAPHVEILNSQGQPLTSTVSAPAPTTALPLTKAIAPAPTITPTVEPVMASTGEISLPVPYFSQLDNKEQAHRTCNTSSCAMVAKYLGAKISGDDEYFQYVSKYGDTTDHNVQTSALTDINIKSTWHINLDFDDLDKSLAKRLPIVIGILHRGPVEKPDDGGHMVVVIGRTASGDYLIHDPYGDLMNNYSSENGEKLTYTRHVLTRRWTVDGKNTGYGRLFDNNVIPGVVSQPVATGTSVQPLQKPLHAPSNSQSSSAIPSSGIELIKKFEGYEENAYADPIHGWSVPTIGFGTTKYPNGRQVQQGDTIKLEQAEQYLIAHIESECKAALERIPNWSKMSANQQGAIYSFAYNVGAAFYGDSNFQSMTKVCDSPDQWRDRAWVESQFVKYCNPGTAAEVGLRTRRIAEAKLFCTMKE